MSEQNFTTTITVNRGPREVFEAITDVRSWWNADITGDATAVGDEFVHHVPEKHRAKIRVTDLIPGERVVWKVLENSFTFVDDENEWVDTEIRFELTESAGGTQVRFTHVGLVPTDECYDVCSVAWGHYIGDSLRNLVTTGAGKPNASPGEKNHRPEPVTA